MGSMCTIACTCISSRINIKYNIKKKQEMCVDCSYTHFWGKGVVGHCWPVWACAGLHWVIFGCGCGGVVVVVVVVAVVVMVVALVVVVVEVVEMVVVVVVVAMVLLLLVRVVVG